ncbi:hypothetical protein Ahy_A03g013382 [Arachis hypogaea]|uniref:PB1-like domain-containing protein n=1 Tax=Arachis hypogaea TaxID=3818 RepID=A0A445DVG9_ARAHY|nr:hypothetical protein Ahy_A03g013382 [Arachis hypogaea]
MKEMLDIMFHHGVILKKIKKKHDTLDVFYLKNYHKKFGYDEIKQCWWHVSRKGLENGLRSLNSDKEIKEMVNIIARSFGGQYTTEEEFSKINTIITFKDQSCLNTKGTQPPPPISNTQNQTKKSTNKVNHVKPNKPINSIQPTKPIKTTQNTKTNKTNKSKQPNKNSISRRPCTRFVARRFKSKVFNKEIPFEVSSDSYESAKDSFFKSNLDEDNSFDSDTREKNVNSESRSRILTNIGPLSKRKEKILVEDDAFVHKVSDEEVDLGFIGSFVEGIEYGLDPGADSDGANL